MSLIIDKEAEQKKLHDSNLNQTSKTIVIPATNDDYPNPYDNNYARNDSLYMKKIDQIRT